MKRTLRLRRETLSELTVDELKIAVGGNSGPTCPVLPCLDDLLYTQLPRCGDITANTC